MDWAETTATQDENSKFGDFVPYNRGLMVNHLLLLDTHLTPKHRETHGCLVSTVATDALVLKHQAISIHSAD